MPPNNQQIPVNSNQQPTAPAGFSVPANNIPQPGVPDMNQQFQPPVQVAQAAAQQPGQPAQPAPAPKQNSTQNSLLLSELRDGMVIMADGSFRAVIACKSINFDLMSSREREGVEYSYQNFLNALYFPVQILVRSQRVDIGPYLDRLENIRRSQDNMLLNVLMDDYIGFIDALSQEANIMDKSFFVVIPYYPNGDGNLLDQGKGLFDKFFNKKSKAAGVTRIDKATYDKAKDEIRNRVDSVLNGLMQVGVRAVQLNTKELGQLYYNVYNPDTSVREPLGDFEDVTSMYIKKGAGEPPAPVSGVNNG